MEAEFIKLRDTCEGKKEHWRIAQESRQLRRTGEQHLDARRAEAVDSSNQHIGRTTRYQERLDYSA